VPGAVPADPFVAGAGYVAAGVARSSLQHPVDLAEGRLHTPEASCGECGAQPRGRSVSLERRRRRRVGVAVPELNHVMTPSNSCANTKPAPGIPTVPTSSLRVVRRAGRRFGPRRFGPPRDRGVTCAGTDGLSIGPAEGGTPTHLTGLPHGVTLIEALEGLGQVPPRGPSLFLPLRLADGTGSPGRALAVLPSSPSPVTRTSPAP